MRTHREIEYLLFILMFSWYYPIKYIHILLPGEYISPVNPESFELNS